MSQEFFDEFDEDSDSRRPAYRLLHASDDEGFMALDIDFNKVDHQVFGQELIYHDHVELDGTFFRAPLADVGQRRAAEELRQIMKNSRASTVSDRSIDRDYIGMLC